jgi:fucose 4-O-acetylase-like acetyltransferase
MVEKDKKRIEWIDACKGFLVILMVLGHIPIISQAEGVNCDILSFYSYTGYFYGCFFMQAFFVLSGITSNFSKKWSSFIWGQAKGLILPFLSFSIITLLVSYFISGSWRFFYDIGNEHIFFLLELYWFLPALLLGKILYWIINRYIRNSTIQLIILFILLIIGFAITISYNDMPLPSHYKNYLHYRNGLCMAIFIWVGVALKKYNLNKRATSIVSILFCICTLICFILSKLGFDTSYYGPIGYSHTTNLFSLCQIPSYMIYTFAGCVFSIELSKKLSDIKMLSYLGKNSIIVYCAHFFVLEILVRYVNKVIMPISLINTIVFFVIVSLFSYIILMGIIKLFNIKPLNYVIGHFG